MPGLGLLLDNKSRINSLRSPIGYLAQGKSLGPYTRRDLIQPLSHDFGHHKRVFDPAR
jgi:hypothetical protein